MMKICHFIASQGLGRGEFYVDLINELSNTVEIFLVIPRDAKFLSRVSSKVHIIEYSSLDKRYNPFLLIEIYTIIKKIQPTIVHTHFAKSTEIFYFINKFLNIIHVATKHNPRKGKIFNKLSMVTAVSQDVAQSIHSKSTVIYNGITPIHIDHEEKNSIFTIVAIGRLEKIKGFDILIKEITKVKQDFRLNIIGDGKEKNTLNTLIHDVNLQNKVKLLGFKENVPSIIANADLVIVSSISEGFSLVILEAIFYGKLLVSTPVGIAKEILLDDFLIKDYRFAEKISEVIQNYDKLQNAFNTFKQKYQNRFLLKNIATDYINFYKNCTKNEKK